MTDLTPSAQLPHTSRTSAQIDERIAAAISSANVEVRMGMNAHLINGIHPANRVEAENMILRSQRDQLIGRVEDLAAELVPMQLALRFFASVVQDFCGGAARLSDRELDSYARLGVQFHRDHDGWFVEAVESTEESTGRKE